MGGLKAVILTAFNSPSEDPAVIVMTKQEQSLMLIYLLSLMMVEVVKMTSFSSNTQLWVQMITLATSL